MNLPVKYRPRTFEEVAGQQHVTRTLQNALKTGRISQAYLFAGPRGVGKTTTARILAKGLNCEKGVTPHPCNQCEICREIDEGKSLDVIEIDGASNRGIEEIRSLREKIRFTPARARYKVYIIDEVHMLTTEAFNALLKTLEEPPPHVIFIFATTEPRKIPETVISRTQRFDFRPLSKKEIAERLKFVAEKEGIEVQSDALMRIAKYADGSLRDGLALMEQLYVFSNGPIKVEDVNQVLGIIDEEIFVKIFEAALKGDTKSVLEMANNAFDQGYSVHEFTRSFSEAVQDLTRAKFYSEKNPFHEIARKISKGQLVATMKIALDMEEIARYTQNPRVGIDYQLIRLSYLDKILRIDRILEKSGIYLVEERRVEEKQVPELKMKEQIDQKVQDEEQHQSLKERLMDLLEKKAETTSPPQSAENKVEKPFSSLSIKREDLLKTLEEHIPFVTTVIEKSLLRIEDGSIFIGVRDDFEKDFVLRHKNKITFILYDKFKTNFSLLVEIVDEEEIKNHKIDRNLSPALKKLMEKFDLEVVEDV